MEPVKKARSWTAALLIVVFAMGAIAGSLVTRAMQQRRLRAMIAGDPVVLRHDLTLRALDTRLGLTAEQHAQAERILAVQAGRYRAALELARPEIRTLRRELAAELGPALDASQRATMEELIEKGETLR